MRLTCRMREIREAADLSVREVAELSGVHRGTISQIETGKAVPLDKQIPALEAIYGPVETWYSARALLALQEEEAA